MSVNSFSSAAAGSLLDNIDSRLVSVMSSTGSYTYNKSLTPGIYLGKCKSLSGAVAPAAAFVKGGTSSSFTSIDSAGTLFNVSSTESSVSMEAYTNGFSSTATTSRNLNALPFDGTHGNNSNGFDIHLYNSTSSIYVGGYCASTPTYSAYPSKFSSDLVTWTDISIPTLNGIAASARTFNKISWVNGLYVYTYLSGTGMKVATSTDLSTWTYKGAVNTDGYSSMNDVIYFNSKYYLAISTGVYSSSDLITWTKVYTGPSFEGTLVTNGTSIVFVMVDVAAYSANGTSWTTYAVNTNGYGSYWRAGAAIPGGKYLFITDTGQRLICNADGTKALQSTNDGTNINYYPSDTSGASFPNRIAVYGSTFYVVSRYSDTGATGRNQAIYTFNGTSVNGTYFRDLVSFGRTSGSAQRIVRSIYTLDGTNFVYTMRIVDVAVTRTRTAILKSVDTQNSQVILGSMASVEAYPYSKGPVTILFSPVENFVEYSLDYGVTWYARPVVYSNKLNNGTIYSFTSYMINSILLKKNGEIVFCTFNTADSTFKFTTFSKTGSKITEAPVKEVTSANSVFSGYSDRMFFLKDEEYMFPISNMSITYTLNGGTTWTTVAYSISNSAQSIPGVAAYSERDGAYYVQGGGNYGVSNAALRKSTDLVSWSNISPSFTTTSAGTHLMYGPTQLIFSGSKAICVNSDGSYITVTDFSATKPEPVAIGSGSVGVPPWIVQDLDGLFYVPGIYNATDNDNGVTYSSDGINWLRKYDTNSSTSIRMNGYRNGKITYIDSNWNEVSVPRIKSTNAIFELYKTSYTTV